MRGERVLQRWQHGEAGRKQRIQERRAAENICAGSAYYSDGSTERQEGSRGYRRAVLQRIYAAQRCGM